MADLPVIILARTTTPADDPLSSWEALAALIAWTENHVPWIPGHERCGFIRFGPAGAGCSCGHLQYQVIDLTGAAA